MSRIDIDTTLLYGADELDYAKASYVADHPDGPTWGSATRRAQGRYLDRASGWQMGMLRHELARPPEPRGVIAWIRRRRQRR